LCEVTHSMPTWRKHLSSGVTANNATELMRSIRDVAVFAWAVVGINGNLANFGHGLPGRGAQPSEGLPVWDPSARSTAYRGPDNQAITRSPPTIGDENQGPAMPPFCFGARPTREHVPVHPSNSLTHGGQRPDASLFSRAAVHQQERHEFRPSRPNSRHTASQHHLQHAIPPNCNCSAQQQRVEPVAPHDHNRNCINNSRISARTPPGGYCRSRDAYR